MPDSSWDNLPLIKTAFCKNCHHLLQWDQSIHPETYINGNPVIICPKCKSYVEISPEKMNIFPDSILEYQSLDEYLENVDQINDIGLVKLSPRQKNYMPDDINPQDDEQQPYGWYDFKNEYCMMGERRINLPFYTDDRYFITVPEEIFLTDDLSQYEANYLLSNTTPLNDTDFVKRMFWAMEDHSHTPVVERKKSFFSMLNIEQDIIIPEGTQDRYYLVLDNFYNTDLISQIEQTEDNKLIINNWPTIIDTLDLFVIPNTILKEQVDIYNPIISGQFSYLLVKDGGEIIKTFEGDSIPYIFNLETNDITDSFNHSYSKVSISQVEGELSNTRTTLSFSYFIGQQGEEDIDEKYVYINFQIDTQTHPISPKKYILIKLTDQVKQNIDFIQTSPNVHEWYLKNLKTLQSLKLQSNTSTKAKYQNLNLNAADSTIDRFILVEENGKIDNNLAGGVFSPQIPGLSFNCQRQDIELGNGRTKTQIVTYFENENSQMLLKGPTTLWLGFWKGEGVVAIEAAKFQLNINYV